MQRTTTIRAWLPAPARRGFTLVEVLIALVLLLIGVYAMFAIFPRGYAAMEASQFRTIGSQLADSELARWKLMPESLPDQIVATDYNGQLIPGTLVGRRGVRLDPDSAAYMLLVWNRGALPMPGSQQYHPANLRGDVFYRLDHVPGALYSPENLTPCAYDGVSEYLSPTAATQRGARMHPNWEPNSVYLARTVIGEQIDVMRLPNQVAGVPFYLLSHAPLDLLKGAVGDTSTQVWMQIYDSRPWQYHGWDPSGPPTLGRREFTYDPVAQKLYFGPMTAGVPGVGALPRIFKLDYTGLVSYPGLDHAVPARIYGAEVTTDSSGTAGLAVPPATPSAMRVYEQLHALTDQEYADIPLRMVWPRNAYHIDAATPVTGKIEFCPSLQTNPQADDITLVKVDYRVRDWQILVFDIEVPAGGAVQLPISHLKGSVSLNPPRQPRPQEVARGIRAFYKADGTPQPRSASDAASWAYVVAVDRQNGDVLTDIDQSELMLDPEPPHKPTTLPSNAYDRRTRVRVDFRGGVLYFNYDRKLVPTNTYDVNVDTPDRSGRTYRVFCRAEADWAVQLLPSARVYARSSPTADRPIPLPDGAPLSYSWVPTKNARQIFLPLSESGQTVTVDYYRKTDGAFIEGELHTIGGPQVVDLGAWVCGLSDLLGAEPNDLGPVTVRGVSVRARAVWVGRGRRSSLEDVAKNLELGARSQSPPAQSLEEAWRQIIVTTFIPRTPI